MTPEQIAALITQTQERLTVYIAAELALMQGGQSYTITGVNGGGRALTRADLKDIQKMIVDLNSQLLSLQSGGQRKMQAALIRDF